LSDLKIYPRKHYVDSARDVILFGSQIHGDSNEDSDFEALVILSDDYTLREQIKMANLYYKLDPGYGNPFDVHVISMIKPESLKVKQPVLMNALRTLLYA
jgi:predicted nucleotidyltransferase